MADNNTNQERPRGFQALKQHVIDNKADVALWASRVLTIIFAIGYMLPIFGCVLCSPFARLTLFFGSLHWNASNNKRPYQITNCILFFFTFAFCAFTNSNAQNAFYKVLLANAATSALRLQQRMPALQFSREYLAALLVEDSCHYLFFSVIYLYVSPFIMILLPVILFAILHAASYSLTLLDVS